MQLVLQIQRNNGERVILFNMSMKSAPSIKDYEKTVCDVAGVRRFVPALPFSLLLLVAYVIDFIARPFGIIRPFSLVHIGKLVSYNNILPSHLDKNGYEYRYSLKEALSDWRTCCPEDWK